MILLLLACRQAEPPVIPDPGELAPLEAVNLAEEIPPTADDPFPEAMTVATGEGEDGVYWAHAKANIHADVHTVWGCLQDTDTVVDRREVDEWTSEPSDETGFDYTLVIHNTVFDTFKVEYDLLWLHEIQAGDADAPETVVVEWQKSGGSNVITLLQGSAVLTRAADGVTRVELIEHLQALLRADESVVSYITDLSGFDAMNIGYRSVLSKDFPARATVKTGLVGADGLVEIMFIAAK